MANCEKCAHHSVCFIIRNDSGEITPFGGRCDAYRREQDDEKRFMYSVAQRELGRIEGIGIGLDSERERILKEAAFNLTRALKVISEIETRDEERKEAEYAE